MANEAPDGFRRYVVLPPRQSQEVTPAGRVIDIAEVDFQTFSGATGTVKVPLEQFVPEVVQALIEERVAAIEQIEQLGG